jgi:drug/metabolite transporter (DMT)-like permease
MLLLDQRKLATIFIELSHCSRLMKYSKNKEKINKSSNWKFILMMITCVVVWAFAFPFIKVGLSNLSFTNLTIMRFFVVCIVFIAILLLQPKRFSKLHKKDILPIFMLGLLGLTIYHLGLNYGEQYISPGAASLIIATIPVIVVISAFIFLKEKITSKKIFGVILALFGVVIISVWGTPESTIEINLIHGAIAVVIAAIVGAFYTIAGKKLLERYNALSLTVYAMLLSSLALIPFLFLKPSIIDQVTAMSAYSWFAVIFLGVFSTVIGYTLWYVGLETRSTSDVSVYLYAIPVLSTMISYFLLDEKITMFFVLGGIFVIVGLWLVNINGRQKID